MKTCSKCHVTKSLDEFYKDISKKYNKSSRCKKCSSEESKEYHLAHPDRCRLTSVNLRYGLDRDSYTRFVSERGNVCEICFLPRPTNFHLSIDHNHVTGVNRGLLCGACNTAIGLLGEDEVVLESATSYLRRNP